MIYNHFKDNYSYKYHNFIYQNINYIYDKNFYIFDINDIKKKYYLGTYINNNIIFNSYGYDIHKWNIIYYKKS